MKINKRFLLITVSHTLVHIFMGSLAPLLPLMREEFGLSHTMVGAMIFTTGLCFALSSVASGAISDKVNRVGVTIFMFVLVGILSSTLILASTFVSAFLLLAFLSFFLGVYHPSIYPYLSNIYFDKKGQVFGLFETGGVLGRMVAPPVAGFIGVYLGWRQTYTLWGALAFGIAFFLCLFLARSRAGDGTRGESGKEKNSEEHSSPKRMLRHYPQLRVVYFVSGFFGFILVGTTSFLPLFLMDLHDIPASTAGATLTVLFVGGLLGNVIGGRYADKWGPKRVLELGFVASSFLLLLIPFTRGLSLNFVLLFAGIVLFMTLPATALFVSRVNTVSLGLAYGIQGLAAGLGAFSGLLCGLVSDVAGIQHIFLLLSSAALLAAAIVCFYIKM